MRAGKLVKVKKRKKFSEDGLRRCFALVVH